MTSFDPRCGPKPAPFGETNFWDPNRGELYSRADPLTPLSRPGWAHPPKSQPPQPPSPEVVQQIEKDRYEAALREIIESIPPHQRTLVQTVKSALDEPTVPPEVKIGLVEYLESFERMTVGPCPEVWRAIPPLPADEFAKLKAEHPADWLAREFQFYLEEANKPYRDGA